MAKETVLTTSVCILGSGPAGIVLGTILQQNGIDCIVIDKYSRQEIYDRGRAGTIESTTVALLRRHNLADALTQNGQQQSCCEFRSPGFNLVFEYKELSGGDVHYIYPQSQLNDSFIQKYLDIGGQLMFHCEGKDIIQTDSGIIVEGYNKELGEQFTIQADFVAGCDGYHGLARRSIPDNAVSIYNKKYAYRWLAVLAYAPPSTKHGIYALHPDGFAAYLLRNSKIARYYLQIPLSDEVEDWPDERVWAALQTRLATDGWSLKQGEIFDKRTMALRNYVMEPLRYHRLMLAGDAGHIITPMGGKGLNLAVQDAGILAETFIDYYRNNNDLSYLDRYSQLRLPYIWRAQEFSYRLLNMLHRPEGADMDDVRFRQKLGESKLAQLTTSKTFARDFARNYVGII